MGIKWRCVCGNGKMRGVGDGGKVYVYIYEG